ncbi:MAG TPA: hypothetical protein VFO29_06110 [Candidatus Rubrimentiphilum sp.]|nr:hypothetical protein [Candidatus Rubrimentiphilum sp.]
MRRLLLSFIVGLFASVPALAGAAEQKETPKPSPTPGFFDQMRFRSLGPAVSGGRLGAVAGTDADPSLYYVGAAGGGVWRSTNAGQSFTPVFDSEAVSSIGAIAIDPKDKKIVWVGTGEGAPRNDVAPGDGVYRSADGGKTWAHVLTLPDALIASILIDPRDSNSVLVGVLGDPFADNSARGMYRTTDAGKTWQKTLYVDARTGVSDLATAAAAPGVVYAGMWPYRRTGWSSDSGGTQGGLYKSIDFGTTWEKLTGNGLPSGATGRIGVAVAPSDPQRVYALIESKSGILWRSDDGGATWKLMSSNTLVNERPFYYTHVFVDPTNEDHLWALSVRLTVSTDGGKTWRIGARGVHGDNHAMWISKDAKRIIEGNDGGPSFSFDNGATWAMPHNLSIAQLYHIGFDRQNPYHVCAPLQDNGVWCAPNNGLSGGISSSAWQNMGGGDGTWVVPDPKDPRIVWMTSGGGNFAGVLDVINTRTNEDRTVSPYLHDQNVVDPRNLKYRFNWETPIAFDPFDPHVLYAGGNVLFATRDAGAHWRVLSGDLTRNTRSHETVTGGITLDGTGAETSETILYIEPSRVRRGEVWIGTDDGYVQLTRDGGKTWRNVTPPGIRPYGRFASLSASTRSAGLLYAAYDLHMIGDRTPHVYMTADYGAHWRDIAANLPAGQEVRSVRSDPRNPKLIYAGLENSLWATFDGGAHWRNTNFNLPATSVRDIAVQPDANDLLLATHGRSVWILDDLAPLQQLTTAQATRSGAYLFAIRPAVQWNTHNYFGTRNDGAGPPFGALITYYLKRPAANAPTADIIDATGHSVRHFTAKELTNQAGFNRFTWDTTENAPPTWKFAPTWNQGAAFSGDSVGVMPGKYTLVVHGDVTLRQPILVQQDPRTHYTLAQMRANYVAAHEVFSDFGRVNTALNTLSTILNEAPLRTKALNAANNGALALRVAAVASQAKLLLLSITQNPVNDQDDDFLTDVLRERLQTQMGTFGGSSGPPTAVQLQENATLHALTNDRLRAVAAFEKGELQQVDAALRAAKMSPLTTLTQQPKPYDEAVGGRRGANED